MRRPIHFIAAAVLAVLFASSARTEDLDSRLAQGRKHAWSGDFRKAEEEILYVTRQNSKYADAWSALGDVYLWSGRPEKALESYAIVIGLMPKDSAGYVSRAKAFRDLRKFSQARTDLARARQLGGNQEEIYKILRDLDRIPSSEPWESSFMVDYQSFSSEREEWLAYTAALKREHPLGSTRLEASQAKRFSMRDKSLALDNYLNLWKRAYANVRYQGAFEANFLPKHDSLVEIFQGAGTGWEISGSYRFLDFPADRADQYAVFLARYVSRYYIRAKSSYVPDNAGGGHSQQLFFRVYGNSVDNLIEFSGGFGKENARAHSFYGVKIQKFVFQRLGVALSANYEDVERTPSRRGFTAQILYRW
ncbi:MAG: hypothetical protein A2901_02140 [Elusimicrobia bacterium RIFCSPLOWO2_01_FULL_54_10]|nr:MAG: hypothetical protein A2901_02140 [Elusimicrobia bacterium RIFCSPLOWO2_01_FULL_54_10]